METEELNPEQQARLTEWYRAYGDILRKHIHRKFPNLFSPQEISDVVTDTLFLLLKNHKSGKFVYRGDHQLKRWLRTTAYQTASNHYRVRQKTIKNEKAYREYLHRIKSGYTVNLLEKMERMGLQQRAIRLIYAFVQELPEPGKTVVILYYFGYDRTKVDEIAKIMGQKVSWVKGQLYQCRKKLKRRLDSEGMSNVMKAIDNF